MLSCFLINSVSNITSNMMLTKNKYNYNFNIISIQVMSIYSLFNLAIDIKYSFGNS